MNYSPEHKKYLLSIKRKNTLVICMRIALLLLILFFWELFAQLKLVDPFITSSPSRIAKTLGTLISDGSLFYHVGITLLETLIGFCIAVTVGVGVSLILWWNDTLRKILEPYIVVLNALPKIALGPIVIIWFGTGMKAIIFMTVLVAIIVATMNMLQGFLQTDENKILLLRSMGATKRQILFKLVIPSSTSHLISMLKVCVGLAWIGSIMGEYIVSRAGIGYLIVYGGQVFKLDLVMSATLILCVLAAGMYAVVALLEKLVLKDRQ